MTACTGATLVQHLVRADRQEDVCFALWYPSQGRSRTTALIHEAVAPALGDRNVHGNASYNPQYFERALERAMRGGAGLAFLHSHPKPVVGWQDMSGPDRRAEEGMAGAVLSATGLPLVGLTVAGGDQAWSARFWRKTAPRRFEARWCETVRTVGEELRVTFADRLDPVPRFRKSLERTVTSWGREVQATLSRLRVGVVGLGSVGSVVAETLARVGISRLRLIDFDSIKVVNLDRTLNAYPWDIGRAKVHVAADRLRGAATAADFSAEALELSIGEEEGYRAALDCDVLFSCVDRPWARSILNFIAYAHLIPVVDGGIHVSRRSSGRMRGADWKAHVATHDRRCLECVGQYQAGEVAADREGYYDDPAYIEKLPDEHWVHANQNVFAFSLATASLEVLQALQMVVSPSGVSSTGGQTYHFTTGSIDLDAAPCKATCVFPGLEALGESAGHPGTARHIIAEKARAERRTIMHRLLWLGRRLSRAAHVWP